MIDIRTIARFLRLIKERSPEKPESATIQQFNLGERVIVDMPVQFYPTGIDPIIISGMGIGTVKSYNQLRKRYGVFVEDIEPPYKNLEGTVIEVNPNHLSSLKEADNQHS